MPRSSALEICRSRRLPFRAEHAANPARLIVSPIGVRAKAHDRELHSGPAQRPIDHPAAAKLAGHRRGRRLRQCRRPGTGRQHRSRHARPGTLHEAPARDTWLEVHFIVHICSLRLGLAFFLRFDIRKTRKISRPHGGGRTAHGVRLLLFLPPVHRSMRIINLSIASRSSGYPSPGCVGTRTYPSLSMRILSL